MYEALRRQYAANARQLAAMATHAERTGRALRGLTAAQWRERADHYCTLSTADDHMLAAHFTRAQHTVRRRLRELKRTR
jgi:hypothetical protein